MSQAGSFGSDSSGDVVGPSSSFDGDIAIFSGTTGKVIVDSGIPISSLGSIQVASVTLTSLQIKSLNGTPMTIIPALGGTKVAHVLKAMSKYNYGGTSAFIATASQSIGIYWSTSPSSQVVGNFLTHSNLVGTASLYNDNNPSNPNQFAPNMCENLPIVAWNQTATEISGNAEDNNTLEITLLYYVTTF